MNSNSLRVMRGLFLREIITLLLFSSLMLQGMQAAAPGWWSTQGVFKPQAAADDYSAVNVGQLKALAAKAAKEMNEQLQQGAGSDINNLIASWRIPSTGNSKDDYAALTQGQLKAVAKLFYDRLAVIKGLGQPVYPWGNGATADDYALANIGQLKTVFAFLLPSMIWRLGDPANPSPDDLNENGISDEYEDSRGWDPDDSEDGPSGLPPLVEAWNNASADVDNGDVIAGVYLNTSGKGGSSERDDGQTVEELIAEAKADLAGNSNSEAQFKIARAGEVSPMMLDYPGELAAYGAYAFADMWNAGGSQVDYNFEYRIPPGITKGLAPFTLNWFEITRHNDGFASSSDQLSVVSRSANLLPGAETSTYQFRPFDGFTGGFTSMFTALSSYTDQYGSVQRLMPTTAAPYVYSYVADPETDVDIDDASQTASITLKGTVWDQLAGALPLGAGADVQTVDIYVNGGLALEDVPLIHDNSGSRDIPGRYHFDPVTVTFPLAENIVVAVETSENLVRKTARYTQTFHFDPVLGDAPQVQPRSIHALLQLPAAFSSTAADTITVLPVTGPGPGAAAVETDIDSRVFVTTDGYVVSVPDGYVGNSTAQTIQCFIPITGSAGAGGSGSTGVLVPGGSSVTCSETGSGTNCFAYNEETEGFELPGPVVDWSYDDVLDTSSDVNDGDYSPFSYFVSGPFKTGELKIAAFQGAPLLSADDGVPYYQNGHSFEAFIIRNADDTGYDLLYANHDAGTVTRAPFSGTLTPQVQVGGASATGGNIGLWTLAWEDLDGLPSSGPSKITADALVGYAAKADHDGVEIPDELCARLKATGLMPGYGVNVVSSEGVDSFTLVPPDQIPTGSAIASRVAPMQAAEESDSWISQQKVIVYESSPNIERITDEEWQALRNAGYLAVHNQSAIATVQPIAANAATGASIQSVVEHEHHLFQSFHSSKVNLQLKKRAAAFWSALGINPDDFTVKIPGNYHNKMHAGKLDDLFGGWTAKWQDFIEANTDSAGKITAQNIRALKRGAIDKMWNQIEVEWPGKIGTDFPIELAKPFRKKSMAPGSSLQMLMDLDHFDANSKRSQQALNIVAKRWGFIGKRVEKSFGKHAFRALMPRYVQVITGLVTLIRTGGNIRAMIAEVTGLSLLTINALAEAPIKDIGFGDPDPIGVKDYVLKDGSYIYIGMPYRVYDVVWVPDGPKVTGLWEGKITDIINPINGSAIIQVTYKNDSISHKITVIHSIRSGMPNKEIWDEYEVGDIISPYFFPTPRSINMQMHLK